MMNSGVEASDGVRRVARRGRWLRSAAVGGVLLLCTAGGFAGARLWDGRGTSEVDLEFAHAVAMDDQIDYSRRRTGLGRIFFFARNAVEALAECETDPELADDVVVFLGQLRQFLPQSNTLSDHLSRLDDASLSADDRLAAARKAYIHAARAVHGLGLAKADPKLEEEIERLLARTQTLLDDAKTGSSK